jgi:hypothetical protein
MATSFYRVRNACSKENIDIDRAKYLHCLLRRLSLTEDEVRDMLLLKYNIQEFEKTNTYKFLFDYLKDDAKEILERMYGEEYTKLAEKFRKNKVLLTEGEVLEGLTELYRNAIKEAKGNIAKDEAKIALDTLTKIMKDFGLFEKQDLENKKFISHFYEVFRSLNAVCPNPECNKEIDVVRGAKIRCRHCGTWIDFRETQSDIEDGRAFLSGEPKKNNMEQLEGNECKIYYDNYDYSRCKSLTTCQGIKGGD